MSGPQPIEGILLLRGKLKDLVQEVEAASVHAVLVSVNPGLDVAAEIGFDQKLNLWVLTLKNQKVPQALIAHELCHMLQFNNKSWLETRISLANGTDERHEFLRDWIQSLLWDSWADFEASRRGFNICGYAHDYFVQYVQSLKTFETHMERSLSPTEIVKLAIDYTYKALDAKLCGFRAEWRECETEFERVAPQARIIGKSITNAMFSHDVYKPEGIIPAFEAILQTIDHAFPELETLRFLSIERSPLTTEVVASSGHQRSQRTRKSS